jgi:hypothetical protein
MEGIRHSALKSCASVLEIERKFLIGKSASRKNKSSLMLIIGNNIDLIISRETIHQRKDFTSGTIVDNLIDEGGRKVVFRTSFVNIPIINAYVDCALFLVDWDKIGNPVSEGHRVNQVVCEKFLNFELDRSYFTWVD